MLPNFSVISAGPASADPKDEESAGLSEAYDLGFATGKAARDQELEMERRVLAAELEETLQSLTFTWEEARAQVIAAIAPLMRGMVRKVLPELIDLSFGDWIVQELTDIAGRVSDAPTVVTVSPAGREIIEPVLRVASLQPFQITEDPSLALHQARFLTGGEEIMLDLNALLDELRGRIEAIVATEQKGRSYG